MAKKGVTGLGKIGWDHRRDEAEGPRERIALAALSEELTGEPGAGEGAHSESAARRATRGAIGRDRTLCLSSLLGASVFSGVVNSPFGIQ